MSALYELTGEFRELKQLADTDDEGMAVAVRDTMEAIEAEFNDKALAVSRVILNLDGDVNGIDEEIKRLVARKRVIENRQANIKEYLRENMEASGITKISCPLFTITLAKGRETVIVDDERKVPDDLVRVKTTIEPDKKAIRDAIKAGQEVPGCHIETGKPSIRIK